jgi:hypothetical protein
MSNRNLLLKCAVLAAIVAAALVISPRFVQRVYATSAGCEAKCTNGTCSADPEDNETCTCACSFFQAAKCTCQQVPAIAPATPG